LKKLIGNQSSDVKNGIIYEKQKWPAGVVPYFISSQFGKVPKMWLRSRIYNYYVLHE
jgi:hypothetical protein